MVDRYAKFATEILRVAAARIATRGSNVTKLVHFCHSGAEKETREAC